MDSERCCNEPEGIQPYYSTSHYEEAGNVQVGWNCLNVFPRGEVLRAGPRVISAKL